VSLPHVLLQTPPYACPHVCTCCDPHANMHTCISTHACKFLCIYRHHHHARACPNPRISAHKYIHMRTHTCPIYLRACTSVCLDSLPRHEQTHPLAHPSPQPPSAHTGIGSCKLLDTSENYGNLELALLVQREAQQNKEAVAENEKSLKRESEASGETGRNPTFTRSSTCLPSRPCTQSAWSSPARCLLVARLLIAFVLSRFPCERFASVSRALRGYCNAHTQQARDTPLPKRLCS